MTTQAERISSLETEVRHLKDDIRTMTTQAERMTTKLDALLDLKSKGQGVFWAASVFFGTVMAVAISYVSSFFK